MGWFRMIANVTIQYSTYSTYVSIPSYRLRNIASYLSKFADFNPPHLRLASPYGVDPGRIYRRSLARENERPLAIVRRCLLDFAILL